MDSFETYYLSDPGCCKQITRFKFQNLKEHIRNKQSVMKNLVENT